VGGTACRQDWWQQQQQQQQQKSDAARGGDLSQATSNKQSGQVGRNAIGTECQIQAATLPVTLNTIYCCLLSLNPHCSPQKKIFSGQEESSRNPSFRPNAHNLLQ